MTTRREFIQTLGAILPGLALPPLWRAPRARVTVEEVAMRSDQAGSKVWFDPVGVLVAPGTTIRWVVKENVHTTTAYHPKNDRHSLRIPEGAAPWDSGYLVNPGNHFEVTLTVPGVYDYYCIPHEAAGMVGRIIVERPLGPGAQPFDYWVGKPGAEGWREVPQLARDRFPSIARIVAEGRVHLATQGR
jgi:plastocyanin